MEILRYNTSLESSWNDFVEQAKNGTFLFDRRYMDYHADRFQDHSLLFFHQHKLCAILPGNERGDCYYSHQGLTYGGFILSEELSAIDFKQLFEETLFYLKQCGFCHFVYKPIPYFYWRYPSCEDRYLLFLHQARLQSCAIAATIQLEDRLPFTRERRRAIQKGLNAGIQVCELSDLHPFWLVMEANMWDRFRAKPVHSVEEMELLHNRFPNQIRLLGAMLNGELLAGALIYDTGRVVRVQYGHASPKGKSCGALDCVYGFLIQTYEAERLYLDFGQCTEENGMLLNEGLIHQKEGFGARPTLYESYQIEL